jgi:hypothetical protein
VPISVANTVSNPSFGIIDSLKAIFHHHCTPFLTAAVLAGALAVATSTLAPAARKPALFLQCPTSDTILYAYSHCSDPSF